MSVNTTTFDIFETLTNGKQIAQSLLTDLAQNQEKLKSIVEIAFGSDINTQKLENLRQKWLAQDFSNLPEVEIRSASEIDGANGAFSGDTNRIYIAEEFIVANQMNLEAIADVFLEEIGHFIDSQINISDSPGDEGAIFTGLVQDSETVIKDIQELRRENDKSIFSFDGQSIKVEQQEEDILLSPFIEQVDAFLQKMQSNVNDQVFGADALPNLGDLDTLPLFGDSLKNSDETQFLTDLADEIRQKINDTFGDAEKASVNQIRDILSELCGSNVQIIRNGSNIIFDLDLNCTKTFETELPSDIGLKQFDFEFQNTSKAIVDFNYGLNLGLGINLQNGEHFFDISEPEDLSISLKPSLLPNASATMGFLLLNAEDAGSGLNFSVDLKDGNDDEVQLSEIDSIIANPEGSADIKIKLSSDVDIPSLVSNDFPSINKLPNMGSTLNVHWDFSENAFAPEVSFKDITVEPGSLISDFLKPIIKPIKKITKPFRSTYEVLNTEIPFLGKLGFQNTKLFGLAKNIADTGPLGELIDLGLVGIDLLGQLDEFIDSVTDSADSLSDLKLEIGDVNLGNFDLRDLNIIPEQAELTSFNAQSLKDLARQIPVGGNNSVYQDFFDKILDDQLKEILSFPILENPELTAKTFLGQAYENTISGKRVEFLNFELPELNLDLESSKRLLDFPGLPSRYKFSFEGSIDANLRLKFSYDSLGLEKWASDDINFDLNQVSVLADGLVIDDHRKDGIDQPEAEISGKIIAKSPEIGVPLIFGFGVDGGIEGSAFVDLEDGGEAGKDLGDSDGQIRGSEILNIARFDPACLVDAGGQIDAFLGGYARLGLFNKKRIDFARLKVAGFDILGHCPTNTPILANEGPLKFQGGVLETNIGENAEKRLFINTTDHDEKFLFRGNGNPTVDNIDVQAIGYTQTYSGVDKIQANGGEFDDRIEVEVIRDEDTSEVEIVTVALPVEFSGENGNDFLSSGNGNDTINGNDGNDNIYSYAGNDLLFGEAGSDLIFAGEGNDTISGGDNSNDINDFLGGDHLLGEAGLDIISGDSGNDLIDGGEGSDTVNYDNSPNAVVVNIDEVNSYSNDTSDADPIDLETNFTIEASTASDGFGTTDILTNLENIIGSESNDVLIGNEKDNEINALTGNDLVIGNAGNDNFDGGAGTDVVSYLRDPNAVEVNLATHTATDGFNATDQIFNIENVVGSEFDDNITGDDEANIITAEAGDDNVKGGAGDDQLYGQTDNDLLKGEAGNDLIDGGDHNDTVTYDNSPNGVVVNIDEQQDYQNPGGYQHTTIVTDKPIPTDTEPDFTIEKGTAQDGFGTIDILTNLENIIGSEFNDVLVGNEKDNQIEGLAGNDIMVGNAGDDTLDGGNDNDTASYRRDPNKVNVNLEQNQANDGFGGTDQIFNTENVIGSDFDDTVTGDQKDNIIHSGIGNDIIEARDGQDIIFGEEGTDDIKGEDGNDFIVGGKDPDKLDGGNNNDTASYFTSESRVQVSLQQGKGWAGDAKQDTLINIENLEGSEYEDLLVGDNQNNILSGLKGNDLLKAKKGNDLIDGGEGNDRLYGQNGNDTLEGQAGNDLISGGQDHDLIDGGEGNDNLHGNTGKDTIEGGEGNDNLSGGAGDDELDGGEGNDNLEGQIGNDNLSGGAGNDQLDGGSGNDNLSGEAGDDQLYGMGGQDNLSGGSDNDLLEGRVGNDQLDGGEGNDRIYGNQGNDYLSGGEGNDLLKGGLDQDTLEGGDGNDELFGQINKDLLKGGKGNDNLWGGGSRDTLYGEEGDDYLNGEGGNDTLEGNEGNDRLYGEQGDDELKGNTGRDYLDGGVGNDELQGNEDNDRIYGREGDDILEGGTGQDILDGGEDDDFMYGEEGGDRLNGGEGEDYLDGGEGDDRLKGEAGDDHLLGQSGRDYLDGGEGEDILEGGEEADLLLGKEGDDYLEGGEGDDELDGGADEDQLYGQEGNDTQTGGEGNDYLEGGEGDDELAGGEGNDNLYGQDGKDDLSGEDGNDNLYGGEGDDELDGGKGNDLLSGEEGNDILDSGDGDDNLEGGEGDDELTAGKGEDQLYGEAGNDVLDAGVGHDYIEDGEGDDEITAGEGDDQAYGGAGNDNINGNAGNDLLDGEEGDDVIEGEEGDDYILGGDGDDSLSAGEGNDLLEGGEGNDSLYGNEGDNILDGGEGDDELYGGSGSDTFVLQQGAGYDSVYNFQVDDDSFELIDLSFEELEITEETESNDNAVISVLDSGEQLAFVEGVNADELTGFYFFPFSSDEVEEEIDEEEVEVAPDAETVVEEDDTTSESESQETDESDNSVTEEENVTSEADETVAEEKDITSESESIETDESDEDESVVEENDTTSDSESPETDESVIEEEDVTPDSDSPEIDESVVEEDDITPDSDSPEIDESVVEEDDITSDSEPLETDESVVEEDDITSDSESLETDESVVEEDDITSDSEPLETDDSDNSVEELEAIASNSPKEKKTDTLTGEEVSTETDDELLNSGSNSASNTDELLLAEEDLTSTGEIEVLELATSDTITEDDTTGSTVNEPNNDSLDDDPVLAAIENTNNALI